MPKSNKKSSKTKNTVDQALLNEGITTPLMSASQFPPSVPLKQNVDRQVPNEMKVENNIDGTSTSKKKKKKKSKKKTLSESENSVTEGDNSSQISDTNISTDIENLAKLPELTVIKLPPQPIVETVKEQPVATSNESGEPIANKKKKNKKKKNSIDNKTNDQISNVQDKTSTVNSPAATCPSNDAPPPSSNASYFKVSQSHNSTVFLVSNPSENTAKQNDNPVNRIEKTSSNSSNITMGPGPGPQYLIKNPEHMTLQNHLLQQMGQTFYSQFSAPQPSGFVSITPVGGLDSTVDTPQMPLNSTAPYQPNSTNSMETGSVLQKSKAQLKAERRAVQEAQRAAKEANKHTSNIDNHQLQSKPMVLQKQVPIKISNNIKTTKESQKILSFSHLPQFKSSSLLEKHLQSDDVIHPAVISVGAQYAKDCVAEPNMCCIEVLKALKNVIKDYKTPLNKELQRDLGSKIEKSISFLVKCRPLSVATLNALKFLKQQIGNIPENLSDDKAKESVCEQVDKFIQDSVLLAAEAISKVVSSEINDEDVILTYGYSSVVENALHEAQKQNKHFRVVIIDSKPTLEGKKVLSRLLKQGIPCSYALISALTYAMNEVTKVIIGAHAVRASGYVMSRIGSSQIALLAVSRNIPFLVCCESYRFCERALIDSFVDNELGDPESFVKVGLLQTNNLENWKDIPHLDLINLLYDVTPPHLISKVITEKCHSA